MFTGIIQTTARIAQIKEHPGRRSLVLEFPPGFCRDLAIGASVAVDGVCLSVTEMPAPDSACFDVIAQTLGITTLGSHGAGARVNVERAAREGAEIGGHPLSGHVDFRAQLLHVKMDEENCRLRCAIPEKFRRYVFERGYIAVNGASLTVAAAERSAGWFEVCLIPETRRATTFMEKRAGDFLNVEVERQTQIIVDTVHEAVRGALQDALPLLHATQQ